MSTLAYGEIANHLPAPVALDQFKDYTAGVGSEESVLMYRALAQRVIAELPDKVAQFKAGKRGYLGLFCGRAMQLVQGHGDPRLISSAFYELLDGSD